MLLLMQLIFRNQNYRFNLFIKITFFRQELLTVLYDALFANDIWQNSHAYFIDIDLITQRS